MAGLEVFGIGKWIRELENMGQNVNRITNEALKDGAGVLKGGLERNAPVGDEIQMPTDYEPWRDGKHARDVVLIGNITRRGSSASIQVGWDKSDNSPHFYMKFQNWGTSKMPNPPKLGFAEKTIVEVEREALAAMERTFMSRITGR